MSHGVILGCLNLGSLFAPSWYQLRAMREPLGSETGLIPMSSLSV